MSAALLAKRGLGPVLCLCVLSAGAQSVPEAQAASADAAPPVHSLSFNLGATTDYRYRGISQTRRKPGVSAGVDYAHASGWYLGAWAASIRWIKDGGGDAPIELDVYGGYRFSAGPLNADLGVLRYQYPGHDLGVSPNTTELYAAATWEVFTLKYSHAVTNLFGVPDSKQSGYLDLSATVALGEGWSLTPHLGRQWVRHHGGLSYSDAALTLGKDFGGGLSASLALIATDADKRQYVTPSGRFTGKTTVIAGIRYQF